MTFNKTMVWFRRDLRAFDHAALHYALQQSPARSVYCVFVYDDAILDELPRTDRRVEFIHGCIAELAEELRVLGGGLLVRRGTASDTIPQLAAELGVDAVFANHDYEPAAIERDTLVRQRLAEAGQQWRSFKDQVIFERSEVLSQSGKPFSVFTPYKNAWLKKMRADPGCLAMLPVEQFSDRLAPLPPDELALPSLEHLGFTLSSSQQARIPAGMSAGAALWEAFLPRLANYKATRDFPAQEGPSGLSVHLRFGTVSIRHLVRSVQELVDRGEGGEGAATWLSELVWREFYAMILFQHPGVTTTAFKPAYDSVAWETGPEADAAFAAWCEGRTGYPLVDAAMLQLNRTGFMHNRLRMVTACFLIKDLGIDWRRGEQYFAVRLNDFELASNNGGWQWAASSGCDAQPWFRIFNPVTQSEKFDANGAFIRLYLPQLSVLSNKEIHAPWRVSEQVLAQKKLRLGQDYPHPIVEHDAARARTLARYAVVKSSAREAGTGGGGEDGGQA
jgi:deoxyribodipyrimidine photo-lyase